MRKLQCSRTKLISKTPLKTHSSPWSPLLGTRGRRAESPWDDRGSFPRKGTLLDSLRYIAFRPEGPESSINYIHPSKSPCLCHNILARLSFSSLLWCFFFLEERVIFQRVSAEQQATQDITYKSFSFWSRHRGSPHYTVCAWKFRDQTSINE